MKRKLFQEKKENNKVLLTGGHAVTTAIAVVEEIKKRGGWDIYWVGPKYAMEGRKVLTLASTELSKIGVKYYPIYAGRIQRKLTRWSIISLLKIPIGFIHAAKLIFNIKPDVIVSFGGYAGFPVVVIGWLLKVPIILHDQTYSFNRANKMSAPFASKILVSRSNSLKYYPKDKCIVVGNPIMKDIVGVKPKEKTGKPPVIYVTGGSTGAQSLNALVEEVLEDMLFKYKVIHQVGSLDYKKYVDIKRNLVSNLSANYTVYESISPKKVYKMFNKSDVIISRAGANVVSEIILTKRPALLIPLVIGNWNEQSKNADYAEKYGVASVLSQESLTGQQLSEKVEETIQNWEKIVNKIKYKRSPDKNASSRLVDIIEKIVE